MAWVFSMALIDGWHRGVERRLTTKHEYLGVIDRFADILPRCAVSPTTSCWTRPATGPPMWPDTRRGPR